VAHPFAAFGEGWEQEFAFQENARYSAAGMPSRLKRFQAADHLHYVTFTCYHRNRYLNSASARDMFEQTLERVRRWYNLCIVGYVVMPEHVHLLLSEPERSSLAVALQMLKQVSSRKLHSRKLHKMGGSPSGNSGGPPFRPLLAKGGKSGPEEQEAQPFWQKRYYDFNVFSDHKRIEKLRYMHRNPVKRGLVGKPEDWKWSSYRHHLTGFEGVVEIESEWTARKREKMATLPKFKHKT
jgi:putative transposase